RPGPAHLHEMKLGHLRSLPNACAAPPAAGLEARARLPVNETYNLHILRACASHTHRVNADQSVRCPGSSAIITPLHSLPGTNRPVNPALIERARTCCGLPS